MFFCVFFLLWKEKTHFKYYISLFFGIIQPFWLLKKSKYIVSPCKGVRMGRMHYIVAYGETL